MVQIAHLSHSCAPLLIAIWFEILESRGSVYMWHQASKILSCFSEVEG